MKFLLDTNILVSAALFPEGTAARAYFAAVRRPSDMVVCDYSLTEARAVFARKFPDRMDVLAVFLSQLEVVIETVPTPQAPIPGADEHLVRDPKDWPILRSAVASRVELLVTGDKDLLEAGLADPTVVTPAVFLQLIGEP